MKSYVYNVILGLFKEDQDYVSSILLYSLLYPIYPAQNYHFPVYRDFLEILEELEQDGLIEIREHGFNHSSGVYERSVKPLTPKEIVAKRQKTKDLTTPEISAIMNSTSSE